MTAPLALKGINYDTGTEYAPGVLSRPDWSAATAAAELGVIARELHCTAVTVFGSRVERIVTAARAALDAGLQVWLQPRIIDADRATTLDRLGALAAAAEELRRSHPGRVTVSVGCELTIFMAGLVPGATFARRTTVLTTTWPLLLAVYNRRLGAHLRAAVAAVRERFGGDVCYGAGSWERVDWALFDLVGVNLYRDRSNRARYPERVRALRRHGKPVVITEFGCCTYTGADAKGGGGDVIVNWHAPRPHLRGEHRRDEQLQADHLDELIDVFTAEAVHGAFVFEFVEPAYPHSADPRFDLDMAGYGIVKVPDDGGEWEPKAAFALVARRFGDH